MGDDYQDKLKSVEDKLKNSTDILQVIKSDFMNKLIDQKEKLHAEFDEKLKMTVELAISDREKTISRLTSEVNSLKTNYMREITAISNENDKASVYLRCNKCNSKHIFWNIKKTSCKTLDDMVIYKNKETRCF